MPKQFIIGLLAAIGGLAGGLLGSLLEEQGKQPNSILNKYGLIGAIATLIISVVVNAWLNTENGLHANWRWHRWRYLKRLKSNLLQKEEQMKFGRLDVEHRKSADKRSPLPQIVADGVRQNMVETLLALIRDDNKSACKALILGEPGSGKTTGIDHLTYHLAADAAKYFGFGRRIPVLARLGNYSEGSLLDFAAASLSDLGGRNGAVLGKGLKKLIEKDQVIVLLDSLDEALGDRRDIVKAQLNQLVTSENYRNLPVVITGRTREDPSSSVKQLQVFEIQDLSDDAVKTFIRNYKPQEADEEKIWVQLNRYNLLEPKGLGRNPFWLRLIVKSNAFNHDKSALLNEAVDDLFGREWTEKRENKQLWNRALPQDVQLEATKSALGWLAYQMSLQNVVTIDSDKASQIVSAWLVTKDRFKTLTSLDVVMLGQDAQLLRYRVQQRIERQPLKYNHRLLQEFFTAWAMHELEALPADVLERFSDSDQYWETLLLLGGLIEDCGPLISAALGKGTHSPRILLAIALLHSRQEIDESIREKLLSAFVKALEGGVTEELKQAAVQLSRIIGDNVVDAIGQLLNSGVAVNVRLGLIEILLALRGDKVVGYLIPLLDDADVNKAINKALVAIGEPAIKPLISTLEDRKIVRMPVMNALTAIGSPAVPALIEELETLDPNLRRAVIITLAKIADERAIIPLMQQISTDTRNPRSIANTAFLPGLVPFPGHDSWARLQGTSIKRRILALKFEKEIQHASYSRKALYWITINALVKIGAPAVPHLIESLSERAPILGVPLILSMIGQPAVEPLIRSLIHNDIEIRNMIVEVLVAIGDPAKEALQNATGDEEPNIWFSAAQTLRMIESASREDDETVDPHVREIKPNVEISGLQPIDFYNDTTFQKKFWIAFDRSTDKVLANLKAEPEINSFSSSIQQLFSQNLMALSDADAAKRLQAVEFFIKVRSIYRAEASLIHQAYSRTVLRRTFAPLLKVASQALALAAGDSDSSVSRKAYDELLVVDYASGFLFDFLEPLQDKKPVETLSVEMANAIAHSTPEEEMKKIESTQEKITKEIEQLQGSK